MEKYNNNMDLKQNEINALNDNINEKNLMKTLILIKD